MAEYYDPSNPSQSLEQMPSELQNDAIGMRAKGKLVEHVQGTEEGQKAIMANRRKIEQAKMQQFKANKNAAEKALEEGDMSAVMSTVQETTQNVSALPYRYANYNPEKGTVEKQFKQNNGKWKADGKVDAKEAVEDVFNRREDDLRQTMNLAMDANRKTNTDYLQNPDKHYRATTKNGKEVHLIPQVKIENGSEVSYLIREQGNDKHYTRKELAQMGVDPETLDEAHKKARIAKEKRHADYYDAKKKEANRKEVERIDPDTQTELRDRMATEIGGQEDYSMISDAATKKRVDKASAISENVYRQTGQLNTAINEAKGIAKTEEAITAALNKGDIKKAKSMNEKYKRVHGDTLKQIGRRPFDALIKKAEAQLEKRDKKDGEKPDVPGEKNSGKGLYEKPAFAGAKQGKSYQGGFQKTKTPGQKGLEKADEYFKNK